MQKGSNQTVGMLTESLDTIECTKGEQRPGWYFAHAQNDLNVDILHKIEGTYSLDMVHGYSPFAAHKDSIIENIYTVWSGPFSWACTKVWNSYCICICIGFSISMKNALAPDKRGYLKFYLFLHGNTWWVLIRRASLRHFWRVPTTFVSMRNKNILFFMCVFFFSLEKVPYLALWNGQLFLCQSFGLSLQKYRKS